MNAHDDLARWPADTPLCALSGDGWHARGVPDWTLRALDELDPADPLADLRRIDDEPGAYVGYLSYDLRTLLEPSASALPRDADRAMDDRDAPALAIAKLDQPPELEEHNDERGYSVTEFESATGRGAYEANVARAVGLIHAGDCFQANIAHRLSAQVRGNTRALSIALLMRTTPAFGAHLELPGLTLISASPELFLDYDATSRRVTTRPIKGTRPLEAPGSELERSEKDRAELAMITDLMRNDPGRIASPASVRVEEKRAIDAHAGAMGVRHASSTVSCTLAGGLTIADLFAHTFPPCSVTGAPKVRAMQIIDALEPVRRHAYCGCVFCIRPDGSMTASVAIRTLTLDHVSGTLDLPVGAGIVADSVPSDEWEETLTKARALRGAIEEGATPRRTQGVAGP